MLLLVRLVSAVGHWAGERRATLQYGEIRTNHLRAYFGLPAETALAPTLLTATNDHGTGHVWVLPGGQGSHAFVLEVPLPDDPDGRLPLHLLVADVDRDGHPNLLVQPGDGALLPYLLDTGKGVFRPPTAAEQGRLVLPR